MDGALFASRIATISLGVMGAMLAVSGIFGTAACSVSKRLKELGIRMALGAQPNEVLRAALGRAFRLLVFGSAAQDCSSEFWRAACWLSSCIRQLPAILSPRLVWFSDVVFGFAGNVDSSATRAVA
jgi:hypothetical protein